jgi:hypothetical protein
MPLCGVDHVFHWVMLLPASWSWHWCAVIVQIRNRRAGRRSALVARGWSLQIICAREVVGWWFDFAFRALAKSNWCSWYSGAIVIIIHRWRWCLLPLVPAMRYRRRRRLIVS